MDSFWCYLDRVSVVSLARMMTTLRKASWFQAQQIEGCGAKLTHPKANRKRREKKQKQADAPMTRDVWSCALPIQGDKSAGGGAAVGGKPMARHSCKKCTQYKKTQSSFPLDPFYIGLRACQRGERPRPFQDASHTDLIGAKVDMLCEKINKQEGKKGDTLTDTYDKRDHGASSGLVIFFFPRSHDRQKKQQAEGRLAKLEISLLPLPNAYARTNIFCAGGMPINNGTCKSRWPIALPPPPSPFFFCCFANLPHKAHEGLKKGVRRRHPWTTMIALRIAHGGGDAGSPFLGQNDSRRADWCTFGPRCSFVLLRCKFYGCVRLGDTASDKTASSRSKDLKDPKISIESRPTKN
ncbi:hypothetical protein BC940DRAFT_306253 [Gongronella butleri]|nr:hypothetical protein BC940DRAFT_306253 [Gongronella butleri]